MKTTYLKTLGVVCALFTFGNVAVSRQGSMCVPVSAPTATDSDHQVGNDAGVQAMDRTTSSEQPNVSTKSWRKAAKTTYSPGADVYLYEYVPVDFSAATSKFELFAASLYLNASHDKWGFYGDYRLRTTRFRPHYRSATWLQQGYISYQSPAGEIRVGSFYRQVGLIWDGTFYGDIEFFDGLKLVSSVGLDLQGEHQVFHPFKLEYLAQYFVTNTKVNGALPGRDYIDEPGAKLKNELIGRVAAAWKSGFGDSVSVGLSGASGRIERPAVVNADRRQIAVDATLTSGAFVTYAEVLWQTVDRPVIEAPQDATYVIAGIRSSKGRFQPRLNLGQGDYHTFNRRREYLLEPGLTTDLTHGFSLISEYVLWRAVAPAGSFTVDKSFNIVLHYHIARGEKK